MTYTSRLLQSLDQQLQQCTDRTERSRLISRRAIHLARLNQLDGAKLEIGNLRSEFGNAIDPISGAWILLAEGIVGFFDLDMGKAFDRLRRSYLISDSIKSNGAIAAASAWLAHINCQMANYKEAISNLNIAISHSTADDHFSRCRAALVAADLYGLANVPSSGRLWQQRARYHSTAEGDESSTAALLLNATSFRVNEARLSHAFNEPLPEDFGQVTIELESSLTFDSLANGIALPSSPIILKGYIHCINNRDRETISELSRAISVGSFNLDRASVEVDLAFANARLGNPEAASSLVESAIDSLANAVDDDEVAYVHARIASIKGIFGDLKSRDSHMLMANQAIQRFREFQRSVQFDLQALPNPATV